MKVALLHTCIWLTSHFPTFRSSSQARLNLHCPAPLFYCLLLLSVSRCYQFVHCLLCTLGHCSPVHHIHTPVYCLCLTLSVHGFARSSTASARTVAIPLTWSTPPLLAGGTLAIRLLTDCVCVRLTWCVRLKHCSCSHD